MPLDDSIDLIIETVKIFHDDRQYLAYVVQSVFASESIGYEEYKNKVTKKQLERFKADFVDTKTTKKKNENILLNFIKEKK